MRKTKFLILSLIMLLLSIGMITAPYFVIFTAESRFAGAITSVPERISLMGLGLLVLVIIGRRKRFAE